MPHVNPSFWKFGGKCIEKPGKSTVWKRRKFLENQELKYLIYWKISNDFIGKIGLVIGQITPNFTCGYTKWCCQYETMPLVAFNLSKQIIVCQNYHLKQNPWRIFCSIILSSRNLLLNTRHSSNSMLAEQIFISKISNSVTDNRLVS